MSLDERANFAKGTISVGIDADDTSIVLSTGEGALFPTPTVGYSCVIWDISTYANPADDPNKEIVRVTGKISDTFTVTRAQEGTSAASHGTSCAFALTLTAKMIADIETALGGKVDKETGKGLSTNDFDDAAKTKLLGIAPGAEVNVQPDWNQTTDTADDYIKNKPTIPTLPVKATGTELDTGTDDDKFATAKALKDSHNVPSVAPGTSGNVLTSNGTDWTSAAPAGGGGAWELVSYSTGTTSSGSGAFSISSLDLATDLRYRVIFEIEGTTGANGVSYRMGINGITTTTYKYLLSRDRSAGGSYLEGNEAANSTASPTLTGSTVYRNYFGEMDIALVKKDGTNERVFISFVCNANDSVSDADASYFERSQGLIWQDGQTNMTALNFRDLGTTGTPQNTYRVWVLKPLTS